MLRSQRRGRDPPCWLSEKEPLVGKRRVNFQRCWLPVSRIGLHRRGVERVNCGPKLLDLGEKGVYSSYTLFPSVPWQRCQFHLQQNAGQYVPSVAMRSPAAADIRAIFNAPDQHEAERLLDMFVERYQKTAPKLATWAEEALPQGFTVFSLPPAHRRRLRTTNLVERLNEEIRRRTRVARLFPNEASCLRLVSAVLMEIAEDWQTADKRYVTFSD